MSTVVVVGAGPLLGKSIAKGFGKRGFNVALIARRAEALQQLVSELQGEGIEAAGFAADITSDHQITEAFDKIKTTFGAVDVLEFSPTDWGKGASKLTSALATTPDSAQADFALLVQGAIRCTREVLPGMLERKRGALFYTTGYSAIKPLAFITSLGIANSGLRNYAYCLSEEVSPQGVYVGTVSINAHIVPGTEGDPDRIASVYLDMYDRQDRVESIFGPLTH
ncbi:MAG TPA: SDR family NAD(P)-dependent oxidoreductase [Burkholderiaceae bacterium]|nr:SDR family NAD(P)-dependent oxidoreductase [Burkholderiaceae bacterium]